MPSRFEALRVSQPGTSIARTFWFSDCDKSARTVSAAVGPIIILLSLGFETFTQQALHIASPIGIAVLDALDIRHGMTNDHTSPVTYQAMVEYLRNGSIDLMPRNRDIYPTRHDYQSCMSGYGVDRSVIGSGCKDMVCPNSRPYATLELCSFCFNGSELAPECSTEGDDDVNSCVLPLSSGLTPGEEMLMQMRASRTTPYNLSSPFSTTIAWIETMVNIALNDSNLQESYTGLPQGSDSAVQSCAI